LLSTAVKLKKESIPGDSLEILQKGRFNARIRGIVRFFQDLEFICFLLSGFVVFFVFWSVSGYFNFFA
jgi:hypothetical protein